MWVLPMALAPGDDVGQGAQALTAVLYAKMQEEECRLCLCILQRHGP